MIKTNNPGILAAIGELQRMTMHNPLRLRYEAYLKKVRDEQAWKTHVWKTAMSEGVAQGRAEGVAEGMAESILELLKSRGVVPKKLEEKILSEKDVDRLRQWLILASKSRSAAEFQGQADIKEE